MRDDVIIQYFREIEDALKEADFSGIFSTSLKAEAEARLDELCRRKENQVIDTAFGHIYYREEKEREIVVPLETENENLLKTAGILDGYEGIAKTLLASSPSEMHGIAAISDPKFIRERYDGEILSEWGITIENNFDYLQSVKKIAFGILSGYMQKLDLSRQKLDVFRALAEMELRTIAEERERLLKQIETVWKYVKERTEDRVLLESVAEDVRQIAAVKEEDFTINHGRVRFSVPISCAEYYRNVF